MWLDGKPGELGREAKTADERRLIHAQLTVDLLNDPRRRVVREEDGEREIWRWSGLGKEDSLA